MLYVTELMSKTDCAIDVDANSDLIKVFSTLFVKGPASFFLTNVLLPRGFNIRSNLMNNSCVHEKAPRPCNLLQALNVS